MKNNQIIGVLGGMGPEASAQFYKLLIYYAQKNYNVVKNEDFPEIYLASIPVPDFINSEKRKEEALEILKDRIRQMNKLPISFFCIACNTAHLLLDDLKKETDKPFVSLLDELPNTLKRTKIKKIGLIASPTTIKSKMYQRILTDNGFEVIIPENTDIKTLGNIIIDTIAGRNFERSGTKVQEIARKLLGRGAEGIIEGCTEIPLIFPKRYFVPTFDTLDILAKACIKRYYGNI